MLEANPRNICGKKKGSREHVEWPNVMDQIYAKIIYDLNKCEFQKDDDDSLTCIHCGVLSSKLDCSARKV